MTALLIRLLLFCLFASCSSWQLLHSARKAARPRLLAAGPPLATAPRVTILAPVRASIPSATSLQASPRSGDREGEGSSEVKGERESAPKAPTKAGTTGRGRVSAAVARERAAASSASAKEKEGVGFGQGNMRRRTASHHFNPLTNRRPAKLIFRPPERFARQFLCIATTSGGRFTKRRESWDAHLRWLRRPALLAKVPPVPDTVDLKSARVEVVHAFTILSEDRLSPAGQLVILRANDTQSVRSYVDIEPLAAAGAATWEVWEMEPDNRDELTNDMYSPFAFLAPPTDSPEAKAGGGLAPEQLAEWLGNSSDLFNNVTRVCLHGLLRPLNGGDAKGVATLFNAHSQRDALRYLQLSVPDDRVRPVNVLDVDGLHHWMPRSAAEAQQLLEWHFEDPLDLWKEDLSVEDAMFLLHVRESGKSFKYRRDANLAANAHADWWAKDVRDGALISAPDLPAEEYDEIDSDMLLGYDVEEEIG